MSHRSDFREVVDNPSVQERRDDNFTNNISHILNKNILLLFQGQLVSQLGNSIFRIGTVLWLQQATGSPTIVGIFLLIIALPFVLLGPFFGIAVDRLSKKSIIVFCDLIFSLLLFAIAAIVYFTVDVELTVVLLIAVSLASGMVASFFGSAVNASIPDLVPNAGIEKANGLLQGAVQFAFLMGQLIGGFLYGLIGMSTLLLINATAFILSAISESFLVIPKRKVKNVESLSNAFNTFKADLAEGFLYVIHRPGLRQVMLAVAAVDFCIAPCGVLFPFFVVDTLKADPQWYGYFLICIVVGVMSGNVISSMVKISALKRGKVITACIAGISLAYLSISFLTNLVFISIALYCNGIFYGLNDVLVMSALQRGTPEDIRGRVISLYTTVRYGFAPISMGLAGVLVGLIDDNIPLFFFCCGIFGLLISPICIFSRSFHAFMASETATRQCSPSGPPIAYRGLE